MLILGRRANQSILFPHCGITVRILGVNGRVAKIGIDAPRHIQVMRGELAQVAVEEGSTPCVPSQTDEEQTDTLEPHNDHIQFAQRLAHIKESLHHFQQVRATGDETKADLVLADLLHEIAILDRDWLENEEVRKSLNGRCPSESPMEHAGHVSEPAQSYRVVTEPSEPKYVLIVNERNQKPDILFACEFPNCQVCTINSTELAKRAIEAGENIDCLVCNCDPEEDDNEKLIEAIRSRSNYENTKVLVVDDSKSTLEQIQSSMNSGIDGWLARPLSPKDLWNHLAESVVFEI